jgi:hypothetical protein
MQNVAKKQNASFAMAFLFVSMVITPLSLKAIGISPNLSAGVEAWRHIAGIFADRQQPTKAAELLALNLLPEDSQGDAARPLASGLLASTQPLDMQLTAEPALSMGDRVAESLAAVERSTELATAPSTGRCAKSIRLTPRATSSALIAMNVVMPIEGIRAERLAGAEAAKVVVPIRREAMQSYERAMAMYRVDVGEAMKFVPNDFKVTIKVKPRTLPALPAITNCAFRKALSPEKVKHLRAAAWSLAFEDAAAESVEKSEL